MLPACGWLHHRKDTEAPAAPAPPPAPIDLNTASRRQIEKLPGVTPSMARRIIEGRPYDDPHDLVERGILTDHELDRIENLVVVKHRGG